MIIATIISILLIILLSPYIKPILKKYNIAIYVVSTIVAITFAFFEQFTFLNIGYLGLAFFLIVMYTGVLPSSFLNYSSLKQLRAEYSILGFIFVLGHFFHILLVSYVEYYNSGLDIDTMFESFLNNITNITGIIVFVIMIPLFITSFIVIRKMINNKLWKYMHKLSYIAYLIIFAHLLASSHLTNRFYIYIVIFVPYFSLLAFKFYKKEVFGEISIFVSVLTLVLLLVPITIFSVIKSNYVSLQDLSTLNVANGTYPGTAKGFEGRNVKVDVEVIDNKIVSITVIDCGCTGGKYENSVNILVDQVIANQTLDLDTIAGTTYSTRGLLQAINDALS